MFYLSRKRFDQGMKKFLWVIFVCAASYSGVAQHLSKVYNQFFMNPYVYNPAYAGVEGHSVLFVMYKNQFSAIQGAPTMMHANFHVPLKGGLGIGALAYNESEGLLTTSGGKISASYLISIDSEHFLRFGMSLGAGTTGLDFFEFDSPSDGAFSDLVESSSFLIGDVGFTYHFGHFNVGASLPNLFSNHVLPEQTGLEYNFKPQDNALLKINYRGHINDNIAIEPHLLYRYNANLKGQLESTVIFHLMHIVWVGGSYRQDAGFAGLIGAKFLEKIGIGYSYEYGNPNTAALTGPSHEIHLGYHLGTKKAHAEHVSSFIKSHRKSADVRAREAELERQRKLAALRQSRQPAQTEEKDEDALTLLAGAKPAEPKKVDTHWSYEKESEPIQRVNRYGETERGIKFDRVNEKGEKEVVFSWLPPPPPGSTEETYEIANPAEEPLIRTKPDGTREAGIKWIRTIDGGAPETLIIWDEILTEEEANKLDHNKAEAHALADAKIVIKNEEPIKEEVKEEPKVIEKPKPVATKWAYEKEAEPVQRTGKDGEIERGIKFDRINEKGEKEVVFSWLPPPPAGASEETYEIANPGEEPLIRTNPDGTKEVGIKWKRTIDGGKPETFISWNRILSEKEAEQIDHNPAEAHALSDAKITIKREEKPVEEKPIIEEEEPKVAIEKVEVEKDKGDTTLTSDFRTTEELSRSDEPLVAKRGGHLLELPAGNYVVAGVFENFDNAENYSDKLFQRGFHEIKVGYLSARGYYYVVISQSADMKNALKEKDRIKTRSGLEKVWVLMVKE